ncbi:MAG TPA: hypothetical protein VFR87_15790 [Nocardioidaceae bacterium]|nr:hypothetical protein [Nocardioidaceae bacterium]
MNKAAAFTTALTLLLAPAAVVVSSPAGAVPDTGQKARTAHERIVDYWTSARRASAVPLDVTLPETRAKGGKPTRPGAGDGGGGGGTTLSTTTGAVWSDMTAAVARTTGKVFFTLGGTNYVCSASAVEGGSVNLVLTAGHCVWDDTAGFASRWVFVPGYDGGTEPYGRWTASALFTTAGWSESGDAFPDDAGLVAVTDGGSGSLAETLGTTLPTMAAQSGQDLSGAVYSAFGYPAAQKYRGTTLAYCEGPVQSGTGRDADTMSMACDMTGGSSGGPWYSAANGTGQIVSVNSYGYQGLIRMFGPTFDSAESVMYAAASDGLCADTAEVCKTVTP